MDDWLIWLIVAGVLWIAEIFTLTAALLAGCDSYGSITRERHDRQRDVDRPGRKLIGVERGHTFSMAVEPKRPEGLISRTTMRMTNETASAYALEM